MPYGEAEIGINEFSTGAKELIGMTPLDSDENLHELLRAIPTTAQGWTCIGCGIQLAIEVSNMSQETWLTLKDLGVVPFSVFIL